MPIQGISGLKRPGLESILNKQRTMISWLINHISHMDKDFADYPGTIRHDPPDPHPS